MQNLLAQRKSKELVEKFKDEDIDTWPEWKAGEASYARGRAFHVEGGAGERMVSKAVAAIRELVGSPAPIQTRTHTDPS